MAEIEKLGPWGNETPQNYWAVKLGEGQGIKEIIISHGSVVDAIKFVLLNKDGTTNSTDRFGGPGGGESKIVLDPSKEHVTHISGTHADFINNNHCISSIKIHTNMKPDGYGPFGNQNDTKNPLSFSTLKSNDGSIVGFHGGYGQFLDSIGIYAAVSMQEIEKLGPWGKGTSQNYWTCKLVEGQAVAQIIINHGSVVDAIRFVLLNINGTTSSTNRFGGPGGGESKIMLDPSMEYVTHISGTHADFINNNHCISSIKIHTNMKPDGYGPFGNQNDTKNPVSFSTLPSKGGAIVGFFGGYGQFLDSIGIYVKPVQSKSLIMLGPWGDESFSYVDWSFRIPDGGHIEEFKVRSGTVVDQFNFTFVDRIGKISKLQFGSNPGAPSSAKVHLEASKEYVTGISGLCADLKGTRYVASITFHTNLKNYGPFGSTGGKKELTNFTSFATPESNDPIVGFHGGVRDYMVAVGVYVKQK